MTWTTALAIAAFCLAAGKFIDKYHRKAHGEKFLAAKIEAGLVRVFAALDDVEPIEISGKLLMIRLPYQLVVFTASALILATLGQLVILAVTLARFHVPLELLPLMYVVALIGQVGVFRALRRVAVRGNDLLATATLLAVPLTPTLCLVLFYAVLYFGALPNVSFGDFMAVVILFALFMIACMPVFMVVIALTTILLLKYATLFLRWIAMKVIDSATDPKTSPFSYFGALGALVVLGAKTLGQILGAR